MNEFIQEEIEAQEAANAQVTPDQAALKPGDFCVRTAEGFQIYSEILDAAVQILNGRQLADLDEDETDEIEYTRSLYQEAHMQFYRFTRSFSVVVPKGELGDIHVCTVLRKLTKDEFEAARQAGWT